MGEITLNLPNSMHIWVAPYILSKLQQSLTLCGRSIEPFGSRLQATSSQPEADAALQAKLAAHRQRKARAAGRNAPPAPVDSARVSRRESTKPPIPRQAGRLAAAGARPASAPEPEPAGPSQRNHPLDRVVPLDPRPRAAVPDKLKFMIGAPATPASAPAPPPQPTVVELLGLLDGLSPSTSSAAR
jgi:hypothetical protein